MIRKAAPGKSFRMGSAGARGLACSLRHFGVPLGARGFFGRCRSLAGGAVLGRAASLAGKRLMRGGRMPFTLERVLGRFRAASRRFSFGRSTLALLPGALGAAASSFGGLPRFRRRQIDSGPACFGKSDGDGLL